MTTPAGGVTVGRLERGTWPELAGGHWCRYHTNLHWKVCTRWYVSSIF